MNQYFPISAIILLIQVLVAPQTNAQGPGNSQQQSYFGFDSIEWERISGRYERSQARAIIQLTNGTEINGQIVRIGNEKMILYPGYEVIIDPGQSDDYMAIDMNDISRIKIKRNTKNYEAMVLVGIVGGSIGLVGGALALWADATLVTVSPFFIGGAAAGGLIGRSLQQYPRRYNFENSKKDEQETINQQKKWAIFEDTIRYYDDFRELVDHSDLVARSFPVKRMKVTAAVGPVGNRVGFNTNIEEVMGDEYPLRIYDGNVGSPAISLSAAVHLKEKFYIGAGWFNRNIGGSYTYDLSDTVFYGILPRNIKGYSLFAEYTPITPDRYLTSRLEVICGAGIVFARSEQYVSWQVHENFTNYYDHGGLAIGEKKLKGLSGHVLANYYVSPNTSLFAGIEGNLFQSLTIPAVNELDLEYGDPLDFQVPEYNVNYSTVHLKFGISFHL